MTEEITLDLSGTLRAHSNEAGRQDAYLPTPCPQNHASNLLELPDGTLLCTWFGGTQEGIADISIYLARLQKGAGAWGEP